MAQEDACGLRELPVPACIPPHAAMHAHLALTITRTYLILQQSEYTIVQVAVGSGATKTVLSVVQLRAGRVVVARLVPATFSLAAH